MAWRQHRVALLGLALLAAGFSLRLLLNGLSVRSALAAIARAHCDAQTSRACLALYSRVGSWTDSYAPAWLFVLPVVAAVFVAAPLIARGYETGTLRFAFTQGVRRARWAVSQLLVTALALVIIGLGPALVGAWWLGLQNRAYYGGVPRWYPSMFDITPVMLPCWMLLGLAAGVLAAVATRRLVAAMATTLVSAAVVLIAAARWLPLALLGFGGRVVRLSGGPMGIACSSSCSFPGPAGQPYRNGIIADGWFDLGRRRLTAGQVSDLPARIPHRLVTGLHPAGIDHWLAARHYSYWISFQPGSRYWLFQSAQAVLVLAAAAALAALAVWLLRRRPA